MAQSRPFVAYQSLLLAFVSDLRGCIASALPAKDVGNALADLLHGNRRRPFLSAVWRVLLNSRPCVRSFREACSFREALSLPVLRKILLQKDLNHVKTPHTVEIIPSHIVCKWIGNSPQVARKHYLQVTDEHFKRAVRGGKESGAQAAQNAAQQAHASSRKNSQSPRVDEHQTPTVKDVTQNVAARCDDMPGNMAEVHGNRTHAGNCGKNTIPNRSVAVSGAIGAQQPQLD